MPDKALIKCSIVETEALNSFEIVVDKTVEVTFCHIPLILLSAFKSVLINVMTELNKTASEVMMEIGINSCTDVTGYGLLGHLLEMCKGSKVSAEIDYSELTLIDGVLELAKNGFIPAGTKNNLNFLQKSLSKREE